MVSAPPSTALLNKRLTSQVAVLEARNGEQQRELRKLGEQNARLSDTIDQLRKIQDELQSSINHLLKRSGAGAPLIDPNQGVLFDAETQSALDRANELLGANSDDDSPDLTDEDKDVPDGELPGDKPRGKKRKPSKRRIDESNLRREINRSELPEEERVCPVTGIALVETGVRVSTELDYRKAELVLIEHQQVVYGPSPEAAVERKLSPICAPAPMMAVEGVTASASLLAWILCQKYVLHLPLYRQEDAFARLNVRLSRKTLCDWFLKSAFALQPVAREIERQIRAGPILHLDDTPIKCKVVNETSQRIKNKQCYLWAFANPSVSGVVFRFSLGRSTQDLANILGPPDEAASIEVFVGDGYATNRSAAREAGYEVRHAGCWAHVLRKYRDALSEGPRAMKLFLEDIDLLYDIEKRGRIGKLDAKALLALRLQESLPIIRRIMRMTSGWQKHYSLQGKVAEAMKYVRNQRHELLEFLRDGRVAIDNNVCERAIRPIALGRRNWLFSGSVDGAEGAAIMYTLVESAKASGVDPLAYLEAVIGRLATWPSNQIEQLTPWAMSGALPVYLRRDGD